MVCLAVCSAGRQCGERAWSIPCDSDFALDLEKSDVADVLQVSAALHLLLFLLLIVLACREQCKKSPTRQRKMLITALSHSSRPVQCLPKTEADHIYAAALLRRSVKPTVPWLHLDLSSAHRPGGLGHVGSDFTGAGVRFAVHMIRKMLE
jgi:leucyl aminopeptidase